MYLTEKDVAKMIDLSCVRTISNQSDIEEMVRVAKQYQFGQVSVLQCFIKYTKESSGRFSRDPHCWECKFPIWVRFDQNQGLSSP